jgi:hypothetical protein
MILPRGGEVVREFAEHLAADVKQLIEDEDTGARSFRYVKTGTNHYSLAFTYDCIAWSRDSFGSGRCFVGIGPRPETWEDPILDLECPRSRERGGPQDRPPWDRRDP